MGGSFNPVKIVQNALKDTIGTILPFTQVQQAQPQVQQQQQSAPAAQAAPEVKASQDSEAGVSNEQAVRRGKRSVTIARSTSSGTGLNV